MVNKEKLKDMEIQTLSLAMSQHLSSLVPGFEGHWVYVYWGTSKTTSIYCRSAWGITAFSENGDRIICPAWQVEDLLRNWCQIAGITEYDVEMDDGPWRKFSNFAAHLLRTSPDTAYQKIEEYLWEILK